MRWLFFVSLILGLLHSAYAGKCGFATAPVIVQNQQNQDGSALLLYWDFPSQDVLTNDTLILSSGFSTYRARVAETINVDPFELLDRYRSRSSNPGDLGNLELIATKEVGRVVPIRCLESLLLNYQISRNPEMLTGPTEFFAVYLADGTRLRVYFLTNDSVGVSGMGKLSAQVTEDIQNGWTVVGNLHNHSFFLSDLAGAQPQGVLAPSASDVKVFKSQAAEWGLPRATITNGFNTVIIENADFQLLHAAE